ncbi:MAG: peptidylprolyl isomerase [Elusimicrobia bacterium]|nr:peptidylprolyl isomerase [Elusimicrobiota bacterium]
MNTPKIQKMLKWLILSHSLTLLLSHSLYSAVVNKTKAKVNDDIILQSEYDKAINPIIEQIKLNYGELMPKEEMDKKIAGIKKEILDQMIDQKLLLQEAEKGKISVRKREIQNGIEIIKERFKRKDGKVLTQEEAEKEFNSELKRQDYTMEQFEDKISDDIKINKLLEMNVIARVKEPTEKELKEYYEKNRDKLDDPEKVSVRHILIRFDKNGSIKDESEALKKIKKIKQELKKEKGENFAKLAEEYSEDPGSASLGGDLGFIIKGMMVKEFEDVAFKTNVGEVSDYFKTEFGYHILKVDAKQARQKRTFKQVEKNLKGYLINERNQEQYEKYIKSLRDKADISIND